MHLKLVAAVGTAVAALSVPAVASAAAETSTSSKTYPVSHTVVCGEEPVFVEGSSTIVGHATIAANLSFHLAAQQRTEATGTGLTTGAEYQVVDVLTRTIEGAMGTGGAIAATEVTTSVLAGPGPASGSLIHTVTHMTITPNGEFIFADNVTTTCVEEPEEPPVTK